MTATSTTGVITLSRPLTDDEYYFLSAFTLNKRMRRHRAMLRHMVDEGDLEDPFRNEVALPFGMDGYWFVGNLGEQFDEADPSVFNKEQPPRGMPGCWCSWQPVGDNRQTLTLSGKKEHHALAWASFLAKKLFSKHWDITASGVITASAHDKEGKITTDIAIIKGDKVISSQEKKRVSPGYQFRR
jgi:hypothetical protein